MSESNGYSSPLNYPTTLQRQIVRWAPATSLRKRGRPVVAANMHLTLAFLGEVSAEKQRVKRNGRTHFAAGFTLHLDDAGQWLRSRVVWLGTRQPLADCYSSPTCCGAGRAAAAVIRARSRFIPIPLLRDAGQAVAIPPPGFHWSFQVNEFALYESALCTRTHRYTPLQRWTLGDTVKES